MKSNLWGVVGIVCCLSCSSRPLPITAARNYETGEVTKIVRVGGDNYQVLYISEPLDEAHRRLFADMQRDCPQPTIVAEGQDNKDRTVLGSHFNNVTGGTEVSSENVTDVFLWVRYRCEKSLP
jgi:hypothetical protein